ncbi:alpha/beta fold hydrolase [Cohnella mopanensis]|uniref:alpha/beta fold hydrolase n=1 Tax=Cohnella mopanensis TaxID=2911966 RepID=UPI001EF9B54F
MEAWIQLKEGKVYVRSEGNNALPPVILLHGTAAYHYCWRNVASLLKEHYHVIIPDLMGMGFSDKSLEAVYSKAAHADRLIEMLQQLKVGPAHLIGHSLGGEIAAHVAVKAPELLASVSFIAPDGFRAGISKAVRLLAKIGIMTPMFRFLLKRPMKPAMMARTLGLPVEHITPGFLEAWTKPYSHPNLAKIITKTLAEDDTGAISYGVPTIKLPALLIYGKKDRMLPQRVFEAYKTALPKMKVEVYEDAGHVIMEQYPERLSDTILNFLNEDRQGA